MVSSRLDRRLAITTSSVSKGRTQGPSQLRFNGLVALQPDTRPESAAPVTNVAITCSLLSYLEMWSCATWISKNPYSHWFLKHSILINDHWRSVCSSFNDNNKIVVGLVTLGLRRIRKCGSWCHSFSLVDLSVTRHYTCITSEVTKLDLLSSRQNISHRRHIVIFLDYNFIKLHNF